MKEDVNSLSLFFDFSDIFVKVAWNRITPYSIPSSLEAIFNNKIVIKNSVYRYILFDLFPVFSSLFAFKFSFSFFLSGLLLFLYKFSFSFFSFLFLLLFLFSFSFHCFCCFSGLFFFLIFSSSFVSNFPLLSFFSLLS